MRRRLPGRLDRDGDPPLFRKAKTAHRDGRLADAEAGYRQTLRVAPLHGEAAHLLGVLLHQTGRTKESVTHLERSIQDDPRAADRHDHLGTILLALGNVERAVDAHRRAVALAEQEPAFWFNLGNALDAGGDHAGAIEAYRTAIHHHPDLAKAHYNLGNLLRSLGSAGEAVHAYRAVLAVEPGHLSARINLGAALLDVGRPLEAIDVYRKAVEQAPTEGRTNFNLALALYRQAGFEEAEIYFRRTLQADPENWDALDHLGSVLSRLGRADQAETCHRRVLEAQPGLVRARYNLGNALRRLGKREEAEACFRAALKTDPALPVARFNLGLLQLARGDLTSGWEAYDDRFLAGEALPDRRLAGPRWDGADPGASPIMVWREQGLGDEIMFATCYGTLDFPSVVVDADPRLVGLLQRAMPHLSIRNETTDDAAGSLPQIPAGSLPRRFRRRISSFPAHPALPLCPDGDRCRRWKNRLAELGPGLKIGICWRSRLQDDERRLAYTRLDEWEALFKVPGLIFVNLQYDECAVELEAATERFGIAIIRFDDLDLTHDLEETAALIAGLDLVVSAATSVGEMAAGLGVPTWRFGRPGDWTMLGTSVRPWFPAMRVIAVPEHRPLAAAFGQIALDLARLRPTVSAEMRFARAMECHRAGLLADAEGLYRQVLDELPEDADALHLLGLVHYQQGDPESALMWIDRALARNRQFPQALHHRGLALKDLRRRREAIAALRQALALRPEFPEAMTHLGRLLQDEGDRKGAERLHRAALDLDPKLPDALTNLGYLCEDEARYEDAEYWYRRALEARPNAAQAHINLGMVVQVLGKPAMAYFDRALALEPDNPLAHWNRGLVLLAQGRLSEGWQGYDHRFRTKELQRGRSIDQPLWRGEPIGGQRLMIWGEQGLGDEILFASCFTDLPYADGPVVIESDRRLVPLFQRAFPKALCRAETVDEVRRETRAPDAQIHSPSGSLPRILRSSLARFPLDRVAFLSARPDLVGHWRDRVAGLGPGLKVGICWRSQLQTAKRNASYCPLVHWGAMFAVPGVRFVNLQYDECATEVAEAEAMYGVAIARWPDADLKNDLETAAALIVNLDLVITAPTAVGELAGALGVPVWRFGSGDDEWTNLGTAVRPWYPAMRPFRSRDGGSAGALSAMAKRLGSLMAGEVPDDTGRKSRDTGARSAPESIETLLGLAVDVHQAGSAEQAAALYRQVLARDERQPVALHLLGLIHHQGGCPDRAVPLITRALEVAPSYTAAYISLGNALQALDRTAEAVEAFRRAIALKRDSAEAWTNCGNALERLGRLDEALACQRRAVSLAPDMPAVHGNLGTVLWRLKRLEEAEACHRRVLILAPGTATAHANLATTLFEQARMDEAEAAYHQALSIDPHHPEAHSDLGRLLAATGRTAKAMKHLEAALALAPSLPSARLNRGLLRLRWGDLIGGWADYAFRFEDPQTAASMRRIHRPLWQGEPLQDRRLMVWREQGLGDEIMFATLYPALRSRAPALLLVSDRRLVPLLARALPGVVVRPETKRSGGRETSTELDFAVHAAAGSVPGFLVDRLAKWPVTKAPLLAPRPDRFGDMADRLSNLRPGLRVGICWRSGDRSPLRRGSYTDVREWGAVFSVPNLHCVNLQYGDCEAELVEAESRWGITIARWPDLDLKDDLEGVAALIANLDLVISAPTAVGELAGALGIPVWRLDKGGDWTTLGTGCRPWFPSMRVIRPPEEAGIIRAVESAGRQLRALMP